MSWTQSPTEDIAVVSKGRLSTLVLMSVAFRMLTDILEGLKSQIRVREFTDEDRVVADAHPTSGKITPLM